MISLGVTFHTTIHRTQSSHLLGKHIRKDTLQMMVDTSKRCEFHVVLVCVICCIKSHYITKMTIVFSACCISLENVNQLSLLIHNEVIEKGRIYLFLSLHLCNK
jgi:hypothetical protein